MHLKAILQALLVTFIWSFSWVLIKFGLKDNIPPFTYGALRYFIAFGVVGLIAARMRPNIGNEIRAFSKRDWQGLIALGIIYYTLTQGLQYIALDYLPAVTLSLLLSFTVIAIALMGVFLLKEYLTGLQWSGIVLFAVGLIVYFYPISIPYREWVGLGVGIMTMLGNAVSGILGRYINRQSHIPAVTVTFVSMGIGATIMLGVAILWEGLPHLSLLGWALTVWLAVVHTAFTFTLWNHTQRTLTSVQSSLINNTMLAQVAILAWIFLGESIDFKGIIGLIVVMTGVIIVQLGAQRAVIPTPPIESPVIE